MLKLNFRISRFLLTVFFVLAAGQVNISAQSASQNYPTPITDNEINGVIPARDLGDARLTSYFYTFNGNQGDVFINIVTSNFDGDIDVFTAGNLKPLTKIKSFSDVSPSETGRVIYLRKPEKLILRIEGRTPNDEPATFKIKFAGSFAPIQASAENESNEAPEVKTENTGEVRVNSVGTIIETIPKTTPAPAETIAKKESEKPPVKSNKSGKANSNQAKNEKTAPIEKVEEEKSVEEIIEKQIIVTLKQKNQSSAAKSDDVEAEHQNDSSSAESAVRDKTIVSIEKSVEPTEAEVSDNETTVQPEVKSKKTKGTNPLENIQLIVLFKDGTKIERSMSEVLKVGVDKGILTIITKEGRVGRYSILDVEKMTIQ